MKTKKTTLDKSTIYTIGAFGISKVEVSGLTAHKGSYAQYNQAIYLQYKPKGAQKVRQLVKYDTGHTAPVLVILEGWGHQDGPGGFTTTNDGSESTYACFDERYTTEGIEFLQQYVKDKSVRICVLNSKGFKETHDALPTKVS